MICGTIRDLWRYPVKSMQGEELDLASIGERGIDGDRRYALREQKTGKIASAKHPRLWGQLLQCAARVISPTGSVRIILPDGQCITTGQDDVNAELCALTGQMVKLVDVVPETPEIERYWPDVEGLALRDVVTSDTFGQGAPAGTFFDYAPLHLLTTATLATLSTLYPTGQADTRRFRSNVVIETLDEAQGFVENDWVGHTLLIGCDIRLRVTNPVPRCVVPTLPQGQLAQDIGILRAIADHNRPPVPALDGARMPSLGIYTSVEQGGIVHVGDTVRIAGAD